MGYLHSSYVQILQTGLTNICLRTKDSWSQTVRMGRCFQMDLLFLRGVAWSSCVSGSLSIHCFSWVNKLSTINSIERGSQNQPLPETTCQLHFAISSFFPAIYPSVGDLHMTLPGHWLSSESAIPPLITFLKAAAHFHRGWNEVEVLQDSLAQEAAKWDGKSAIQVKAVSATNLG